MERLRRSPNRVGEPRATLSQLAAICGDFAFASQFHRAGGITQLLEMLENGSYSELVCSLIFKQLPCFFYSTLRHLLDSWLVFFVYFRFWIPQKSPLLYVTSRKLHSPRFIVESFFITSLIHAPAPSPPLLSCTIYRSFISAYAAAKF